MSSGSGSDKAQRNRVRGLLRRRSASRSQASAALAHRNLDLLRQWNDVIHCPEGLKRRLAR